MEKTEKIDYQVDSEDYLGKLPKIDRENLQMVVSALETVLREKGRSAVLKAVGGTIDKPHPRKDIDLTLRLMIEKSDPTIDDPTDYLEYSKGQYKIFRDLIRGTFIGNPDLEIVEEIEPAINEEFQSTSILKNDGTIKIKPKVGTPIEVIRVPEESDVVETRPFVTLTQVPKAA